MTQLFDRLLDQHEPAGLRWLGKHFTRAALLHLWNHRKSYGSRKKVHTGAKAPVIMAQREEEDPLQKGVVDDPSNPLLTNKQTGRFWAGRRPLGGSEEAGGIKVFMDSQEEMGVSRS